MSNICPRTFSLNNKSLRYKRSVRRRTLNIEPSYICQPHLHEIQHGMVLVEWFNGSDKRVTMGISSPLNVKCK